jgi:hypothetical protein
MPTIGVFRRAFTLAGVAALVAMCATTAASAQDSSEISVQPGAADHVAARQATHRSRHPTARQLPRGISEARGVFSHAHAAASAATPIANDGDPSLPPPAVRYPADVVFQGGTVVDAAESHAVYMLPNGHCEISTCWGNPEGFLRDLARSDFVHLLDQYVGRTDDRRYTVGHRAKVSFTPPSVPFTDNDMVAVVHAIASRTGNTGYGHIYHIFLPQGIDECFDNTFTVCYSPDNPNAWKFCAYHGSADTDIGHLVYSVEPYQNVPGCNDPPTTPNGQLVDSTNDVLSHELFETISDPDGTGWWNSTPSVIGVEFEEIGDECVFTTAPPGSPVIYGDPSIFTIGEHVYAVQLEYSNSKHGCAGTP